MKINKTKITLLFLKFSFLLLTYCYFTNNTASARNVQINDENTYEFVISPDIKSVKIHKQGLELSNPAIDLRNNERIIISFDDISDRPKSYSYSIIHCDSDWNPSPIFLNDFLDGFEVNEIRDYSYSSGTVFSYMHCRLEIPNNDVKLRVSGNYIIRIFNTYEPDVVLLQRRFIVYESLAGISARVRQPSAGMYRYSGQQLDLQVNTAGLRISDPHNEIKAVVCQNHLFQGCKQDVEPVFIRDNEIDYSHPDALIFEGGNEFRIFDLKNIRFLAQGIQSINYHGGMFHAQLNPDKSRRRHRYSTYTDLNGRYVVSLERSTQSQLEADYVWTYFTLEVPMELDQGFDVYVFGELTGWQLSPDNRMEYNPERKAYEKRLFLKQGLYSYRYVVANQQTGEVDIAHYEGSYYETENNYMVLVYYKPIGARYERIVGYESFSSVR